MENNQDNWIKDLQNLETSYSPKTNFDEVMNRRKKKRRGFFWWTIPTSALLLLGIGTGYYYFSNTQSSVHTTASSSIKQNNSINKVSKPSQKEQLTTTSAYSKEQITTSSTNSEADVKTHSIDNNKYIKHIGNRRLKSRSQNNAIQGDSKITIFNQDAESTKITDVSNSTGNNLNVIENNAFQIPIYSLFNSKNRLSHVNISNWKTIPSDIDWIDLDLREPEIKINNGKLPWFVEFSAITGSNNQINFDNQQNLSILGTQYIAQYQGSILREFQNATMWGLGVSYTEWVGNGQWRNIEEFIIKTFDSTVMDSVFKSTFTTTTGMINYRIDKISIPVQFRFHTQLLKVPIRIGAQLSPGFTTLTSGDYFNETSYAPIQRQKNLSFDGKLTVGPMIPITNQLTIIIEPSLVFQSFRGQNNQWNAKSFTGLGIAMMWRVF